MYPYLTVERDTRVDILDVMMPMSQNYNVQLDIHSSGGRSGDVF